MMSKLIVSLLCFFSIFAANAQAKTLMVFGDSLSAAYNLRQQQGWVSLLGEQINQSHPDITIINASISGETTQGGLARLPKLLETHQPTWFALDIMMLLSYYLSSFAMPCFINFSTKVTPSLYHVCMHANIITNLE